MTSKIKILYTILCLVGLMSFYPVTSYAQHSPLVEQQDDNVAGSESSSPYISIQDASYWDDGVTYQVENLSNNRTQIVISPTDANQEESSTLFIYDHAERDLSTRDAMSVYIENTSSETLYINFNIAPTNSDSLTIPLDESIWLQEDGQENFEVSHNSEHGFGIPAGFSGELYIPLKVFSTIGSKFLKQVETIGLTVTILPDSEELSFVLGNIHLESNSLSEYDNQLLPLELVGSDVVTIPETGASTINYEVTSSELDNSEKNASPDAFTFALERDIQGIQMSKDGELEIFAGDDYPSTIEIIATDDTSGTFVSKKINLKLMDKNLAAVAVPNSEEVASFSSEVFVLLNSFATYIRIGIAVVIIAFSLLFWSWFKTYQQNRASNRKQLKKQVKQRKRVR